MVPHATIAVSENDGVIRISLDLSVLVGNPEPLLAVSSGSGFPAASQLHPPVYLDDKKRPMRTVFPENLPPQNT
jgi:hypothetical protein